MNDKIKTVTVPLSEPVTVDGKTYDSLTFRRMKARDTLVADDESNQIAAGYKMFAALADVSLDVILELDIEDLAEVGVAVAPLMGKRGAALVKELGKELPGAT